MMKEKEDSTKTNDASNMTFWDHVDELRKVLFRIIIVTGVLMLAAFCFKDELFGIILAPKENDFIVYQWFDRMYLLPLAADEVYSNPQMVQAPGY